MAEAKKTTKRAAVKAAELIVEAAPAVEPEPEEPKDDKAVAKAGKRSTKALKEAEVKEAKAVRKTSTKTDEPAAKPKTVKPPRSRAERAGKKYREAAKLVEADKQYSLKDALELAVKTSTVKFDAAVELHINLGVDPKQADQNVRDTVVMPAGTGKDLRVATLADDADGEKLFSKLDKEEIDFDVLVAAPAMMAKLGKYARLLGPRGLMPNPKSGTVTANVAEAVKEAKAGKVEYRVDQAGIIHLAIGKVSFGGGKLLQNAEAVMSSVRAAKPSSLKGIYLKSLYVTTTMGPSVKVDVSA